ncbi:MAG TPA: hypothetical protein VGR72_02475 [Candidatus Acidoferrales bacterium]|nr:hypothetical protein [Candidatus Acidoferrales bacterium]
MRVEADESDSLTIMPAGGTQQSFAEITSNQAACPVREQTEPHPCTTSNFKHFLPFAQIRGERITSVKHGQALTGYRQTRLFRD